MIELNYGLVKSKNLVKSKSLIENKDLIESKDENEAIKLACPMTMLSYFDSDYMVKNLF